jgi:hypothetical protein
MSLAEAHITLGVIAARQGDPEQAVYQGERAISGPVGRLLSRQIVSEFDCHP